LGGNKNLSLGILSRHEKRGEDEERVKVFSANRCLEPRPQRAQDQTQKKPTKKNSKNQFKGKVGRAGLIPHVASSERNEAA